MPRPKRSPPSKSTAELIAEDAASASLIYSAVKLRLDGLSNPEIAMVLGCRVGQVTAAFKDIRAGIAERRFKSDAADGSRAAWGAERAAYRVSKAWDVLESELDSKNEWLRHQAALSIIAADAKRQEQAGSKTEIIIAPELSFDDQTGQYLQAPGADTAIPGELTDSDAIAN